MKDYIIQDWLVSEEMPDMSQAQPAPQTMPQQQPPEQMPQQNAPDPNIGNSQPPQEPTDISGDPAIPDMPEEKSNVEDFEVWRNQYLKESIKGDTQKLTEMLGMVRDKPDLTPYQTKFVEDNWDIQLLRQNANIDKASKDIRRNLKDQLDRNNPATSVVNHMTAVLDTQPFLNNIFIKLKNYRSFKGDLHRKFVSALLGGVQVGSGGSAEDVIVNEKEYSILISTRFNSDWGDVVIGNWSLKDDDADRYLSDPEKKRLQDGSPEEREVLKKRIIVESIASLYNDRAFVIGVVADDGTIYTLGWDITTSLRGAYTEGKIVIKLKTSDDSEAMITEDGNIVPLMDLDIFYTKETGQQKENGQPEIEEIPFIERKNGNLILKANLKTIQNASQTLQGMVFKETPYNGNPSDLQVLSRCVMSAHDLIMKQC